MSILLFGAYSIKIYYPIVFYNSFNNLIAIFFISTIFYSSSNLNATGHIYFVINEDFSSYITGNKAKI